MRERRHRLDHRQFAPLVILFLGMAVAFPVMVSVFDLTAEAPGDRYERITATYWPLLTLASGLLGLWILATWLAGPIIVNDRGMRNPFSWWRGRWTEWSEIESMWISAGLDPYPVLRMESRYGERRLIRLNLVADATALLADIEELSGHSPVAGQPP